jgi:hypothetical protein
MKLILSFNRSVGAGLARLLLCGGLLLTLTVASPPATAVEMEQLYTVEVQLDPADSNSRNNAYQTAMTRVLVRMTGSAYAAESEELVAIFANPSRYVLRYRPGPDNSLVITFDGNAIEDLLRRSGHPIWGNDRPMTLVWLAVDWGQGEREIVAADDESQDESAARSIDRNRLLRERVLETAAQRGIPVIFPLLDTEDLQSISFSDIWAGFDDRLLMASARYDVSSVLVGRIRTSGLGQNRWTYYFGNEILSWPGEPEQVVHLVADSLAQQLAFSPNTRLETIRLAVAGVDSVSAYGAVHRYLSELNLIEDFSVHSVAGSDVNFDVKVYGGQDRLSKALELSRVLERANAGIDPFDMPPTTNSLALEFVYRP